MNITPLLSTPIPVADRINDWELASIGVEFLFTGGYSLEEQGKKIGNHRNCGSYLRVADPQLDEQAGGTD